MSNPRHAGIDLNKTYGPSFRRRDADGAVYRGEGPMTESMTRRRDAAIKKAGEVFAASQIACAQMTPREQAEAAWTPTSRHSVDELEDLIRADRGLAPIHGKGADAAEARPS